MAMTRKLRTEFKGTTAGIEVSEIRLALASAIVEVALDAVANYLDTEPEKALPMLELALQEISNVVE